MTLRYAINRGIVYLLLALFAALYLLPIYVLVITSFKSYANISTDQMWNLPRTLDLSGFTQAWSSVGRNMLNSVLITVPAAIISSLIGAINGYVFAKWRFPGSNAIFLLFMFGLFLPYQGVLIPLVITLQHMRLYGTIPGVIFVHCVLGIPITALMFRSYFVGIPMELTDAAKMDGCGFFGIFRWLILPLAPPAFAVVLLWQFTNIWNDYLLSVVVLSNPSLAPVNVAVQNLAGSYSVQWNIQMAGALIAAIPTVIVYLLLGRLFMRGLLAGAIKG